MTRAGNVTVTPVTLRTNPISIPSRQQSSTSSTLLEDEIGAGDYITLTSTNPALVFPSLTGGEQQDREVPLDSITLDTDRGLVEESLTTANRVLLSRPDTQTQLTGTGLTHSGDNPGHHLLTVNQNQPVLSPVSETGVSVTNVSPVTTFSSQSSTAQLVTISQGSISLLTQTDSMSGYTSQEPLPALMTRDQMMSSTILPHPSPRDQMLSSQGNVRPQLMAIANNRKDHLMSPPTSRGMWIIPIYRLEIILETIFLSQQVVFELKRLKRSKEIIVNIFQSSSLRPSPSSSCLL